MGIEIFQLDFLTKKVACDVFGYSTNGWPKQTQGLISRCQYGYNRKRESAEFVNRELKYKRF